MIMRKAISKDAEVIVELIAQLGYTISKDDVADNLNNYQQQNGIVIVAEDEETILGVASGFLVPLFHAKETMFRITALCVHESKRAKGVGKALIGYLENWCEEQDCYYIEVTSGAYRKNDAHLFYRQLGYSDYEGKRFLKRLSPAG